MYEDLRDLAEQAMYPELPNDDWIELHRLASQFTAITEDGPGPVPDALREEVRDALLMQSDGNGPTLIPDDEFEDYAREFAEDIGAIDSDACWFTYCIDWEQAARDLQMDYTAVEFRGQTWWNR